MSRFALVLAILGLVAFALPTTHVVAEEEGTADVAAPAEGGEAQEGEATEGGEEAKEGEEEAKPE